MEHEGSLEYIHQSLIELVREVRTRQVFYDNGEEIARAFFIKEVEEIHVHFHENNQLTLTAYDDLDEAAIAIFIRIQNARS